MGSTLLWVSIGVLGASSVTLALWVLHKLLLRAEEKGWIYYRRRRGSGTVSSGVAGAMMELDRIVRPSVEHVIEMKKPVLKLDQKDGE